MDKRIFIAIPLPNEIKKALETFLLDIPGKVVPATNWHFTLQFLGKINEDQLKKCQFILSTLNLGSSFSITLGKIGAFPKENSAKVLWIGVEQGAQPLISIAKKITDALFNEGFDVDKRPFIPHLTISRFFPRRNVTDWIKKIQLKEMSCEIKEIVVFESILGHGPAEYHSLFSFTLSS